MEYIKPTIKIVFFEELMETINTTNAKEGDASEGRAKEMEIMEEEPEKIITKNLILQILCHSVLHTLISQKIMIKLILLVLE